MTARSTAYETGFRKTAEAFGIDPDRLAKHAAGYGLPSPDQAVDEMGHATSMNAAKARLRPMARVEMQRVQNSRPGETVVFDPRFIREYASFSNRYGYSGNPLNLAKTAQALRTLTRPFTRYWELLAGTGKATRGYRALGSKLDSALNSAIGAQNPRAIKRIRDLRRQLDVAANNYNIVLEKPFWDRMATFGISPDGNVFGSGLRRAGNGGYRFSKGVTRELDKVLMARFGTGGAALGGGYLALSPGGEEEE